MAKPRLKLHIISHIEWDREGLSTFQESRLNLVRLLDRLMTMVAAHPRFGSLILGGQNILIEDYLEVRSEYRGMLCELAQSGKLSIGPWYVLPNEFLVSPEALIHNLWLGEQTAAGITARCDLGYLSCRAAHIGQLPQILSGFGLHNIAILDCVEADTPLEQWWLAPDGSAVMLVSLYQEPDNRLSQLTDSDTLLAILSQIGNRLKDRTKASSLAVLCDSNNHEPPSRIIDLIDDIEGQLRGVKITHGDLPSFLAEVSQAADSLVSFVGEMFASQMAAGSLSTHMRIKQYNHEIQNLLERWAEPFGAWAGLLGDSDPRHRGQDSGRLDKPLTLIDRAWQLLLTNHASPSISGQIVDQVHREMQVRFDQAAQIGTAITGQSLAALAEQIDTSNLPGDEQQHFAIVFNAASQAHTDLLMLEVPPALRDSTCQILDSVGASLPVENIDPSEYVEGTMLAHQPRRIAFIAHDVPAFGYKSYIIQPIDGNAAEAQLDNSPTLANQYLSVAVNTSDGTLSLFDKITGRTFAGLNHIVDGGDCGDTTGYRSPPRDTLIDIATNMPLQVARHTSSVQQELSYLQIFRLPQQLTAQRDARLPLAAQFVPVSIMTTLRVNADIPRLDVEVEVSNNALDHRLRVHFPTGIDTTEAWFDGHFEVVRRPIPGDYPQRAFVTIMGANTGLTVANRGLPEVAVIDGRDGVEIALTLLRSVGWLHVPDASASVGGVEPIQTPDAQCRGIYRFSYSLIPHGTDPVPAWHQAWAYQTPFRGLVTSRHSGTLPTEHSLVTADNPLFILSTAKTARAGNGVIIRGYNISSKAEQTVLNTGVKAAKAQLVRIDETPTSQTLKPDARGRYMLEVGPAEIVTLYIAPVED